MARQLMVSELIEKLNPLPLEERIKTIYSTFGNELVFASSMGAEDQVITDVIVKHCPEIRIITLDTGRLFPETYKLIDTTRQRYGKEIEVFFPDYKEVESMVRQHGINLFYHSIENRKLCCRIRKIEPLKRALEGAAAWITGLRREQSVTRIENHLAEWDGSFGLIKINPLIDWTEKQVWDYIVANNVPYNSLHDKHFPSIGCQPCTRAVLPGEDIRAGRWWWENPEQKECGLHWKNH